MNANERREEPGDAALSAFATDEACAKIAEFLAKFMHLTPPPDVRIVSTREAARYIGRPTSKSGDLKAFRDWSAKWNVVQCGQDRWRISDLDTGLRKEGRVGKSETRRRRQTDRRRKRNKPSSEKTD
jgi:hypothetical protein